MRPGDRGAKEEEEVEEETYTVCISWEREKETNGNAAFMKYLQFTELLPAVAEAESGCPLNRKQGWV